MRTVFCRRTAGRAGAFELANDVVGVVVTSTGRLRSLMKRSESLTQERRKRIDMKRVKDNGNGWR